MKILKENQLLKVLSLNSISVMISFVLGLISTKIVSFFLGPAGMALIGSFRNFTSMLKSTATLGINNTVIKLYVENQDDKKELSIIYSTLFWFFLIVSGSLGLVLLLFAKAISAFLFFTNDYSIPIRFFGLLLPLIVINAFWLAVYNGLEQFKRIVLIQIFSNVLVFGITALLIWYSHITGGLLAIAVGEFLMVLVTFLFVLKDRQYFQFDLQKIIERRYIDVIWKFSSMALLSAVIGPLTLLLIRNTIISDHSIEDAGMWDAVNRLSGFYMTIFNSGLSLYYMPKLTALTSDSEFKSELKMYFKVLVPLFLLMVITVFLAKDILLTIAFTKEFYPIKGVLVWQLAGDFIRIMTLAFGYQIVVKTMIKKYIFIEVLFNLTYLGMAFYFVKNASFEGALKAYFFANVLILTAMIFIFRRLIFNPISHND